MTTNNPNKDGLDMSGNVLLDEDMLSRGWVHINQLRSDNVDQTANNIKMADSMGIDIHGQISTLERFVLYGG